MRFHKLALYGFAIAAARSLYGNGGCARADEITTPPEANVEETVPYSYPEGSEAFEFQAEVNKMLDIVVNSLYQNKDVFLRELISNAQDALDKIRFLSIENPELMKDKDELEVKISYDRDEKTITITDSGIGMTHDELVNNLGTVARSGTSKFIEAMQEGSADMSMIGQFGVGFYSTFLVADRVRVASKSPSEPVQYVWESMNGEDTFHLYEDPRGNTLGRGTEITLFLKEDAVEYLDVKKLKTLSTFYSEFLTHPILIRTTKTIMVPKGKEEKEESLEDIDELEMKDEDEEEEEEEEEMEEVTTEEWEQLNTNKPIWSREKDDITDDEYQSFYKIVSKGAHTNATRWIHFNAEGNINFKSILYLPGEFPTQLYNFAQEAHNEMRLYVKRVLISDSFPLLPRYLGYVKGVVDSEDLPLNVNRETLQEDKIVRVISKKLVRKVIEMIRKLSQEKIEDEEEEVEVELDEEGNPIEQVPKPPKEHPYIKFYKEFGHSLKYGAIEDKSNRDKLMKLLRFKSSKFMGENDWVSLSEYIERMKDWQTEIFYLAGEKLEQIDESEYMDLFKSKDVEVLYFDHPFDEYLVANIMDFDGKKFQSIAKANIKLKDEDEDLVKRRQTAYTNMFKPLKEFLKKTYGDSIFRTLVSTRLIDAPAMISGEEWSYTANMERIFKAQASDGKNMMGPSHKVFEFNPRHPFMIKLNEMVTPPEGSDEEFVSSPEAEDLAWLIHDTALLQSGYPLPKMADYSKRMSRIMQTAMGLDSLELAEEINPPEEEDEPPELDEMPEGLNIEDFDLD